MLNKAHYSLLSGLNTGAMSSQPNRSEAVITDYKKRKLKRSALRRIQDLLLSFEDERAFDRRLARIGVFVVVLLVVTSLYWLASADSMILR
jgi:hypothetical protein